MSSLFTAKKLIKDLKKNGYDAYLVGGVVRDFLMKSKFNDIDITTKAKPFEVMKIFKTIPTKVTLNEYIEISKYFSTPKSKIFVNGILDRILKKLTEENAIVKKGIGLLDS